MCTSQEKWTSSDAPRIQAPYRVKTNHTGSAGGHDSTKATRKQLTILSAARWSGVRDKSLAALHIGAVRLLFLLLRRSRRRWNVPL